MFRYKYGDCPVTVNYAHSAAVTAGQVLLVAGLVLVAATANDANAIGGYYLEDFVGEAEKSTGAIAIGDDVYWNPTGDPVTGTAGTGAASTTPLAGALYLGKAVNAPASGDSYVRVLKINPRNPLTLKVADPGASGAIPVLSSGSMDIVTAAAETRTIAAPSFRGQQLSLCMKTDGGDCVITVATGINQTGNTTITMNDAGDSILLVAIQSGSNLRWRVAYNDGCTLG